MRLRALRGPLKPCGEVRDAAPAKSAGLPQLDAASIRWAQGATFPEVLAAMPGVGGFGLLPFTFEAAP